MKQWFLIAIASLLMSGCATLQVQTYYDQEFDFTSWSKFSVIHTKKDDGKNFLRSQISKALAHHLENKGYESVDKENADFYVTLHLNIQEKSDIETNYETMGIYPRVGYFGRPHAAGSMGIPPSGLEPYWAPFEVQNTRVSTRTYSYEEGRLVVEILDVKSNAVVWHGIAEDELVKLPTPEEKRDYINGVLEELFKDFPTCK